MRMSGPKAYTFLHTQHNTQHIFVCSCQKLELLGAQTLAYSSVAISLASGTETMPSEGRMNERRKCKLCYANRKTLYDSQLLLVFSVLSVSSDNSQPYVMGRPQSVHHIEREKWTESFSGSSALSLPLMKEGLMEEVSEVEVHVIPGDASRNTRAFQVLRIT